MQWKQSRSRLVAQGCFYLAFGFVFAVGGAWADVTMIALVGLVGILLAAGLLYTVGHRDAWAATPDGLSRMAMGWGVFRATCLLLLGLISIFAPLPSGHPPLLTVLGIVCLFGSGIFYVRGVRLSRSLRSESSPGSPSDDASDAGLQ